MASEERPLDTKDRMHSECTEDGALTIIFSGGRPKVKQLRKSMLVVLQGADKGKELQIDRHRVTGGRSIINDLVLNDKAVSGAHFEVASADDGFRLRDLASTNGTFIGGMRIREVYLGPGTEFIVGHTVVRFQPTNEVVEIALSPEDRFGEALGGSVAMREIFAVLEKVSPSDITVLITGPTGTGKEVVARAICQKSRRREKPFVVLDCGAIPRELIESTLFGHEKGSFTGAVSLHRGCFEQADGGTIFLDEIGELDLSLQPKLLRVLENRELKRVGGSQTIGVDVRVLVATNRDLKRMVSEGKFREDLYFRLSVIQVDLPPLSKRREDIPQLANHFLSEVAGHRDVKMAFSLDALKALQSQQWSGNVRELRNVVERAASLVDGPLITRSDLLMGKGPSVQTTSSFSGAGPLAVYDPAEMAESMDFKAAKQQVVESFEREYIKALIARHQGNITRSAAKAGLTRYHLRELIKRHGIT